jgi:hypothetical protein
MLRGRLRLPRTGRTILRMSPRLPDPGRGDEYVGGRPLREHLARASSWIGHRLVGVELPWALITWAIYGAALVGTWWLAPHISPEALALLVLIGTWTASTQGLIGLFRARAPKPCPRCGYHP